MEAGGSLLPKNCVYAVYRWDTDGTEKVGAGGCVGASGDEIRWK